MTNINQYEQDYTKNWCGILTYLNIFKYRYWIIVEKTFFIKVCIFAEKMLLWTPKSWAVFSVLYNGLTKYLNSKLWLKFKVETNTIANLKPTDWNPYWIGVKGYSSYKFRKIKEDWEITKSDIDWLSTFSGGFWHNLLWDWTAWGFMVDTDWSKAFKFPLSVLKYWAEKDIFWQTIRTITPVDKETEEVCKLCIWMFQAEKQGKLQLFYNKHSNDLLLDKAKLLYFYWK